MKTPHQFSIQHADMCCPERAYRFDRVFAVVRASSTMRYIFADGRTLTIGTKTRYATFPRPDSPMNAVNEALEELREKHPRTRNLYLTLCPLPVGEVEPVASV